jgi:hypothetical protein
MFRNQLRLGAVQKSGGRSGGELLLENLSLQKFELEAQAARGSCRCKEMHDFEEYGNVHFRSFEQKSKRFSIDRSFGE